MVIFNSYVKSPEGNCCVFWTVIHQHRHTGSARLGTALSGCHCRARLRNFFCTSRITCHVSYHVYGAHSKTKANKYAECVVDIPSYIHIYIYTHRIFVPIFSKHMSRNSCCTVYIYIYIYIYIHIYNLPSMRSVVTPQWYLWLFIPLNYRYYPHKPQLRCFRSYKLT